MRKGGSRSETGLSVPFVALRFVQKKFQFFMTIHVSKIYYVDSCRRTRMKIHEMVVERNTNFSSFDFFYKLYFMTICHII